MISPSNLIWYDAGGFELYIQERYQVAEKMIIEEVKTAYAWDFPITAALDIGAHIGAWTLEANAATPMPPLLPSKPITSTMRFLSRTTPIRIASWRFMPAVVMKRVILS